MTASNEDVNTIIETTEEIQSKTVEEKTVEAQQVDTPFIPIDDSYEQSELSQTKVEIDQVEQFVEPEQFEFTDQMEQENYLNYSDSSTQEFEVNPAYIFGQDNQENGINQEYLPEVQSTMFDPDRFIEEQYLPVVIDSQMHPEDYGLGSEIVSDNDIVFNDISHEPSQMKVINPILTQAVSEPEAEVAEEAVFRNIPTRDTVLVPSSEIPRRQPEPETPEEEAPKEKLSEKPTSGMSEEELKAREIELEEEALRLRSANINQQYGGGGGGGGGGGFPGEGLINGTANLAKGIVGGAIGVAAFGLEKAFASTLKGAEKIFPDNIKTGTKSELETPESADGTSIGSGNGSNNSVASNNVGMKTDLSMKNDVTFNFGKKSSQESSNDPVHNHTLDNIAKEKASLMDSMNNHGAALDRLKNSDRMVNASKGEHQDPQSIANDKEKVDYKMAMDDIESHGDSIDQKLERVGEMIRDNGGDPEELNEIVDHWKDKTQEKIEELPDTEEKQNIADKVKEVMIKLAQVIAQLFSRGTKGPSQ
jgi:hypothetical protein